MFGWGVALGEGCSTPSCSARGTPYGDVAAVHACVVAVLSRGEGYTRVHEQLPRDDPVQDTNDAVAGQPMARATNRGGGLLGTRFFFVKDRP